MKKRIIRCFQSFASLSGKYNIEVFYTVPDFGHWNKLFTCIECGELFVVDLENPIFANKDDKQIAGNISCPKCGKSLSETIRPYPENFRTDDGQIGHFNPGNYIPSDNESLVHEFVEIG